MIPDIKLEKQHYGRCARESTTQAYYVYAHRCLDTNKIFYVGKGKGYRAWCTSGRNIYWQRMANKHGVYVDIIFDSLEESESYECEYNTILELLYFGEKLTNLTDGGVGGLNPSKETREKMSKAKRGLKPHNFGKKLPSIAMDNNGVADLTIYRFVNESGIRFEGTRYDLVREYSLKLSTIGKLFYKGKNRRKRIYGWSIEEIT